MKRSTWMAILITVLSGLGYIHLESSANAAPKAKVEVKRGVGLTTYKKEPADWKRKLEALKVSWHYTWGYQSPGQEPGGIQFVPMVFSRNWMDNTVDAKIGEILATTKASTRSTLLGFNEPDNAKQSNVSVELALKAWPAMMKTGARLGSPACVNAEGEWMRQFMQEAKQKNLRVDFVAVHWYGHADVKQFIAKLKRIHELYDKPVWITEFAVADWKAKTPDENRYSPEVVQQFMKKVLPELDQMEFIERYAWFPSNHKSAALTSSSLFNEDGSLTELGTIYAQHP